jgi:hypothetical protein
MKLLSFILLCVPLLINGKPIIGTFKIMRENCEIPESNHNNNLNYNLSCVACEFGVSVINYENQNNNLNQTMNYLKYICNSTLLQPYQNMSQECNTIYRNIPIIVKQLSNNQTTNQICSYMSLC